MGRSARRRRSPGRTIHLWTLRERLPQHIAFNVAALLRGLRPVIQVDLDDGFEKHVATLRKLVAVETIEYHNGVLVFLPERTMPPRVRRALDAMKTSTPSDARRHAGVALELVCPPSDPDRRESFRVLMGVADVNGNDWYFKSQMCVRASSIRVLQRELQRYDRLAHEMGFTATVLKVVQGTPEARVNWGLSYEQR